MGSEMCIRDSPHIVDLDDIVTGPAAQDLWLFLSGDRHYQAARLQDLLSGYRMFYDFDPAEINLIEALRTLRIIRHAAWLDQRRDEPAFRQAFPWTDSARYWDDHIIELKEQSAALDETPLQIDGNDNSYTAASAESPLYDLSLQLPQSDQTFSYGQQQGYDDRPWETNSGNQLTVGSAAPDSEDDDQPW